MEYLKKLDEILLSDNVVENFYEEYNKNKSFKDWLLDILPEVEDCEKQQQNNPWHKYNVLGHILHSVEEMNKQTKTMDEKERRKLAYVMFFHDIGKPATHITRRKDGKIIDSFFGHNKVSEEIADEVLDLFGFSDEDIDEMLMLINKHDIFMFIRDYKPTNPYHKQLTKKLLQDEINELDSVGNGKKIFRNLVLVGRADNLAQNENMTAESLALLDKTESMLI